MNTKRCFIVSHLSLGDQLIINGLIRYFSSIYSYTYLLCKKTNLKSTISIFSDNNSIIPISVNTNNYVIDEDHYLFNLYKDCDIIKIGVLNNNWYILKSNFNIDNLPYSFFETFYKQQNLDYKIRYNYEKINRNFSLEDKYYKSIMHNYLNIINNITNNKYIFVHYNIDNNKIISDKYINKNIPIFHPNINYYTDPKNKYYNYWNGIISNNITDYCKIIEKSYEIHVTFSSFLNLCVFLNLSKVTKKYIYTKVANIKDLHENLKDWHIIPC